MLVTILIASLTALFTLSSRTEVVCEGTLPVQSNYCYLTDATTGSYGQLTCGKSSHLQLTGWDGCRLRGIRLNVHSNQSSGSGSLSVLVGQDTLWSVKNRSFSSTDWAGQYMTDWVEIGRDLDILIPAGETVDIIISATENSLYVGSYEIDYEPSAVSNQSSTMVNFVTGLDTVPAALQATDGVVVLPAWCDTLSWFFVGWSETPVSEGELGAAIYYAGDVYTVTRQTTLWAVYSDIKERRMAENVKDGNYVLAMYNVFTETVYGQGKGLAMSGCVDDACVGVRVVDICRNEDGGYNMLSDIESGMVYDVWLDTDSMMYIENALYACGIGYADKFLVDDLMPWRYRMLEDNTLGLYYECEGKNYALYIGSGVDGVSPVVAYAQPMQVSKWTNGGMIFFPAVTRSYTSWPCGEGSHVLNTEVEHDVEGTFRMGMYEIRVKNGKKYLQMLHM